MQLLHFSIFLTLSSLGLSSSASLLFSTVITLSRSFPCASIFFSLSFSCFSCFCRSLLSFSKSLHSSSSRKRWRFWNSALISRSSSSNLFWKKKHHVSFMYIKSGLFSFFVHRKFWALYLKLLQVMLHDICGLKMQTLIFQIVHFAWLNWDFQLFNKWTSFLPNNEPNIFSYSIYFI